MSSFHKFHVQYYLSQPHLSVHNFCESILLIQGKAQFSRVPSRQEITSGSHRKRSICIVQRRLITNIVHIVKILEFKQHSFKEERGLAHIFSREQSKPDGVISSNLAHKPETSPHSLPHFSAKITSSVTLKS